MIKAGALVDSERFGLQAILTSFCSSVVFDSLTILS